MKTNRLNLIKTFHFLILAIGLVGSTALYAQTPVIQWQKSLGGPASDQGNSVQQTSDGGYVMAGKSSSNSGDVSGNHGSVDVWVVKVNASGVLQWQNSLGGPGVDSCQEIRTTEDGGYILVGTSNENGGDVTGNHGLQDVWVVKLDAGGNLQWQKSLGGSQDDLGEGIQQTADGGYVLTGSSKSNDGDVSVNQGLTDIWVVKLSNIGNIEWQRTYGGSASDSAESIQQTTDGGYVIAGTTSSVNGQISGQHGGTDYWVFKINTVGSLQWQNALGGTNLDFGNSIEQTNDGGYIVTGSSTSNDGDVTGNNGSHDLWVTKLNPNGSLQWQHALGGSDVDVGYDIHQTNDGGYIVAGQTNSNNGDVSGLHGDEDYWVVRLNTTGDLLWQKTLGGTLRDARSTIETTLDGGYVVFGFSNSTDGDVTGNHGASDFWVVKLGHDPLAISDFNAVKTKLFPNPTAGLLQIKSQEVIAKVLVFNLLGQPLLEQSIDATETTINLEAFTSGTYLVQITTNHKTLTYQINKQ